MMVAPGALDDRETAAMAEPRTIAPGSLLIASSSPFPPFAVERDGTDSGFDAELMRAVCGQLGLRWNLVKFDGADCNSIFDGLRTGDYDTVVAATTITPEREMVALFSEPYLEVEQALLVNTAVNAQITSTDDLSPEVVGIETGRTSESLADELLGAGQLRDVRRYPCRGIPRAIEDLLAGRVGGLLTLAPVATWFARDHEELAVVQTIDTGEQLGVAFAPGNVTLRDAVNEALDACRSDGVLERLGRRWLEEGGSGR
jgi:polar amino acid transport system substrate-binding protein